MKEAADSASRRRAVRSGSAVGRRNEGWCVLTPPLSGQPPTAGDGSRHRDDIARADPGDGPTKGASEGGVGPLARELPGGPRKDYGNRPGGL
ncbi:hypothetical protein GCM10022420_026180 [Streptomyces iranensis]